MKFLRDNRAVVYGAVASALIAAAAAGWSAVNFLATLRGDATASTAAIADHEQRLRAVEEMRGDLAIVKRDVSWIRGLLGRRPADAGGDSDGGEGLVFDEGPEAAGDEQRQSGEQE